MLRLGLCRKRRHIGMILRDSRWCFWSSDSGPFFTQRTELFHAFLAEFFDPFFPLGIGIDLRRSLRLGREWTPGAHGFLLSTLILMVRVSAGTLFFGFLCQSHSDIE